MGADDVAGSERHGLRLVPDDRLSCTARPSVERPSCRRISQDLAAEITRWHDAINRDAELGIHHTNANTVVIREPPRQWEVLWPYLGHGVCTEPLTQEDVIDVRPPPALQQWVMNPTRYARKLECLERRFKRGTPHASPHRTIGADFLVKVARNAQLRTFHSRPRRGPVSGLKT